MSEPRAHTRHDLHHHAEALHHLCTRLEREGLSALDQATVESIPALLASASSALAQARSQEHHEALVRALETQLFRASDLLRRAQKPTVRHTLAHWFYTLPTRLWASAPIQALSLLLMLCGGVIAYRMVSADPLRVLSFFPEAAGGTSIADQLVGFSDAQYVQMWLQAPMSDIAFLIVSFDVQLFVFFAGYVAAALLLVWAGGWLTPLLLLAFGGAHGALFAALPSDLMWPVAERLFPLTSLLALALMLAQSAGFHVFCAWLPDRRGRRARASAAHLQSAVLQTMLSAFHIVLAAALLLHTLTYAGSAHPRTAVVMMICIVWWMLYVAYGVLFGSTWMQKAWPIHQKFKRAHDADPLPYAQLPPKVRNDRMSIDLREGPRVKVQLARYTDRFAASVVDGLIVMMWFVICVRLLLPRIQESETLPPVGVWAGIALIALPIVLYSMITEWRWHGQTIGKKIFEIKSIRIDGERQDSWTLLIRSLAHHVEGLLPIALAALVWFALRQHIGYVIALTLFILVGLRIFPLFTKHKQRLGDRITGTVVIEVPDLAQAWIPPSPAASALDEPPPLDLSTIYVPPQWNEILGAVLQHCAHDDTLARQMLRHVVSAQDVDPLTTEQVYSTLSALYARSMQGNVPAPHPRS